MVEGNTPKLLITDLGMMRQASEATRTRLDPERLDSQPGFVPEAESALDAFADTMRAVELARTSPEDLTLQQLKLLELAGYRLR